MSTIEAGTYNDLATWFQMDEEFIPVTLALSDPYTSPMSGRPHAAQMAIQAILKATQSGVIVPNLSRAPIH
jgi:hypothetical protein